jgi:hemerythrin
MTIQWTTDLATGLDDIDHEHEMIHQQIEGLVEKAANEDGAAAARAVVEVLKRHVLDHFADEYDYMVAYAYSALEEHCAEHAEILEYVRAFEEELLAEAEPELLVAATRVLSNWILTHTNTFDRDFARHMRSQA